MSAQLTATKAGRHEEPERGNALAELVPSARTLDRIARLHGEGLSGRVGLPGRTPGAGRPAGAPHQGRQPPAPGPLSRHDGSLDHDARMSLRADIERIEKIARTEMQGRGTLAIFACSGAGVLELVRLPRPVRDRIMVDATPWIGPMLAVLDQYRRGCAVVVDRESAHVWELYLGEMRDAGRLERRAPRERRVRRLAWARRAPRAQQGRRALEAPFPRGRSCARSAVPRRAIRRPRRRRARTRAPRLPRIPASDAARAGGGNVRDRSTHRHGRDGPSTRGADPRASAEEARP